MDISSTQPPLIFHQNLLVGSSFNPPEEILSKIFALAFRPVYPHYPDGVGSILRVSKFWRQTAHGTASLWNMIELSGYMAIELKCTPGQLKKYLERSRGHGLDISLYEQPLPEIQPVIEATVHRWKKLRWLTCKSLGEDDPKWKLISRATNLEDLHFELNYNFGMAQGRDLNQPQSHLSVFLPSLKTLQLKTTRMQFIRTLTCPMLTHLNMDVRCHEPEQVVQWMSSILSNGTKVKHLSLYGLDIQAHAPELPTLEWGSINEQVVWISCLNISEPATLGKQALLQCHNITHLTLIIDRMAPTIVPLFPRAFQHLTHLIFVDSDRHFIRFCSSSSWPKFFSFFPNLKVLEYRNEVQRNDGVNAIDEMLSSFHSLVPRVCPYLSSVDLIYLQLPQTPWINLLSLSSERSPESYSGRPLDALRGSDDNNYCTVTISIADQGVSCRTAYFSQLLRYLLDSETVSKDELKVWESH